MPIGNCLDCRRAETVVDYGGICYECAKKPENHPSRQPERGEELLRRKEAANA